MHGGDTKNERVTTSMVRRAEDHAADCIAFGVPAPITAQAQELVTLLSYHDEAIARTVTMLRRGVDAPSLRRRLLERWRVTDLAHARAVRQASLPLIPRRRHAHHP